MLKQNKALIPIIIFILILCSIALGWWLSLPRGDELPASIRIISTATEDSGIPVSSQFSLKSEFAVNESSLRQILELSPPINYALSGGGKEWTLSPIMPLKENTVYTIGVKNSVGTPVQSFAFQTRTDLLVNSVFPQEKENYVDINTGIEIKFNRPGVDLSQGFEILPPVSGRFDTLEYTCRFIPDAPLAYNSTYRISLKGLKSSDGAILTEPIIYNFSTREEDGKENWNNLSVDSPSASFLPGGDLKVGIWGSESQAAENYKLTLHKYAGIRVFEAALRQQDAFYREQYGVRETYRIPTIGLDEVMNVESLLMYSGGKLYAPLPQDISEGYYLFTLESASSTEESENVKDVGTQKQFVQQLIQVVNLSVYTQSTGQDTLFWLGDPVTARPAIGAEIELETGSGKRFSGKTDSNGLLSLQTNGEDRGYALITREGTPVWVSPIPLSPQYKTDKEEEPLSTQYYSALYMDREVHQPGEPIAFWGVVKPRTNQSAPTQLRATIVTHWPDSTICEIPVEVLADGTFRGELQPETLQSGSYALELRDLEGRAYLERYVEISSYTKPAYQITLKTDKDFYYYGETVNFSVEAHYYDGTPAAGVKLLAQCYSARVADYGITLNSDGKATFKSLLDPSTMRTRDGQIGLWQPEYVGWNVSSTDEQAVNLYQSANFLALPSKIAAKMEYEGGGKVIISSAFIDENKLLSADSSGRWEAEFDRYQGNPADIPMTLVVHRITYRQTQTGNYYDAVNKKTVPLYETTAEEAVERNVSVNTVLGTAVVEGLPSVGEEDISYWYELRFAGGVFGDVCEMTYPSELFRQEEVVYTFFADATSKKAAPGDLIDIGIYENGMQPQSFGTVLYTLVQDHTIDYGTFNRAPLALEMKADYLPNIWLVGAYFDGKSIYPVERTNISYEYAEKVLQIQAVTDQENYRPGDTMQVNLTVTDAEGNPVSGQVAVGVVDEAVFDIAPQTVNLAEQIYKDIYYPSIVTSVTKSVESENNSKIMSNSSGRAKFDKAPANTAGGDMGGITRNVFADTAAFQVISLSENGTGSATLALPHNITSWRITAAAVTPQLQAGDHVTNVKSSLPFYLMPIVTDTYLLGDDVSVSALAVGTALDGNESEVTYTATLTGTKLSAPMEQTVSARVGKRAVFHFGKLEAGGYRVKITGTAAQQQDTMELPLTVVESGLLTPIVKTVELSALSNVQSQGWPVQVTIYNDSVKPMFETLSWLCGQNGQRAELLAASTRAREIYQELLPLEERQTYQRDERLSLLMGEDDGVVPLPGASSDPALTSKMFLAAPELLNHGNTISYLQNILKDPAATPDDRVMAYVGLAAAKEPVLLDLHRLYDENLEILKPYQKLYIGVAFARLGDFSEARKIYESVPMIRSGDIVHADEADETQTTAAALLLASELSHEDANGLAAYLMRGNSDPGNDGVLWHLELLAYAKKVLEQGAEGGKFSYEANGTTNEVELDQGTVALSVDSKTLKEGRFRSLSGKLYAAVQIWQPGNSNVTDDFAEITKTYEPIEKSLVPGGQVKVTTRIKFKEDAPYGVYTLSDYIPSGLRWLSFGNDLTNNYMRIRPMISQNGQKISGTIYRIKPNLPGTPEPLAISQVEGAYVKVLSDMVENLNPGATESSFETAAKEPQSDIEIVDFSEQPVAHLPAENSSDTTSSAMQEKIVPPSTPQATTDTTEYDVIIEYYLSAALPGSFVTESTWLGMDSQTTKSERGVIVVEG